jgi:hypothetical protein
MESQSKFGYPARANKVNLTKKEITAAGRMFGLHPEQMRGSRSQLMSVNR